MNSFVILGIHDKKVETIQNNVARVRMYVGDQVIDQDFSLPQLPSMINLSAELYRDLLTDSINARMAELEVTPITSTDPITQVDDVVTSDITITTQPVLPDATDLTPTTQTQDSVVTPTTEGAA